MWSHQIENYNQVNVQALSIIKAGSVSCPKEAELQSPLPDNGAILLSLQETLCGCRPKVLGNLRNEWINGITQFKYGIQTFKMVNK